MKYERMEVRLDKEHQSKVADLAAQYGTSGSEAVRRAIDEAHEEVLDRRRREALARILASQGTDDVADIETIKRESGRSRDHTADAISDSD